MKCLLKEESSAWLKSNAFPEEPYGKGPHEGASYVQFLSPKGPDRTEKTRSFINDIFRVAGPFEGSLISICDWIYDPDWEPDPTIPLRKFHGQEGSLRDKPDFLFSASEETDAKGLCDLVFDRYWNAYLYLPPKKAVFLFYEGEINDCWCWDKELREKIYSEIGRHGLKVTSLNF